MPRNFPMLDGLRGLAALIVLVSHSALAGFLPAYLGAGFGQTGVAIFYALSGFLMAHVCFDKPLNLSTGYAYAIARGSRVLPLFYLVALANVAILAIFGWDFYDMQNWSRVVRNLALVRGDTVLWSIPVEIQFYFLFAGIWWAQQRGYLWHALFLLGFFGMACVALRAIGVLNISFYYLPFWLHFFIIGVASHVLINRHFERIRALASSRKGWALGFATLLIVLLLPPEIRAQLGQPRTPIYSDPFVILSVPLLLIVCCAGIAVFRFLGNPVMRWFGKISFSLYLLHWPVLELAKMVQLGERISPTGAFVVAATISIGAAALTNRMVEQPAQTSLRSRLREAQPRFMMR